MDGRRGSANSAAATNHQQQQSPTGRRPPSVASANATVISSTSFSSSSIVSATRGSSSSIISSSRLQQLAYSATHTSSTTAPEAAGSELVVSEDLQQQQQLQEQHTDEREAAAAAAEVEVATGSTTTTNSSSLPLCYDRSELFTLGSRPGMECMPLRSPPGPYHYHVTTDQTKSLQELQNEVGALLEFRDLVIETFPDLKHKMASISASNTITGLPTSSLASRRDWEPGIRVRRKLTQKEHAADLQQSSSSLIRSRSNSHSGKKEPKSSSSNGGSGSAVAAAVSGGGVNGNGAASGGEGNGSVVQDSGFSTETSSSKEAHSASSTSGGGSTVVSATTSAAMRSAVAVRSSGAAPQLASAHQHPQHHQHPPTGTAAAAAGGPHRMPNDADDELWNLLDVIHRKSMRLRDEVDRLQQQQQQGPAPSRLENQPSASAPDPVDAGQNVAALFRDHLDRLSRDDVQILRKERDKLLEKLFQMEGEALADRLQSSRLQDDMDALLLVRSDLETQLQLALSQKLELNARIQDMQSRGRSAEPDSGDSHKYHQPHQPHHQSHHLPQHSNHQQHQQHQKRPAIDPGDMFASAASPGSTPPLTAMHTPSSPSVATTSVHSTRQYQLLVSGAGGDPATQLGRLDGVVSTPQRSARVRVADSKKFEAILLETNIVELQRHLLTIIVQNQVLTQRLEQATKSKIFLNKKLVKANEDIDDLRFQLEEKSIDLEGTRAQLRIVETKTTATSTSRTATSTNSASIAALIAGASQVSTPSMKAMTPLAMDDPHQHHVHNHNSSSTESAQDQTELDLHALQLLHMQRSHQQQQHHHHHHHRGGSAASPSNSSSAALALAADALDTPSRKRPSKIPLPGTKGYLAPKPPTGRSPTTATNAATIGIPSSASATSIRAAAAAAAAAASGPASGRSLSRSTGSLASTVGHHHHHHQHSPAPVPHTPTHQQQHSGGHQSRSGGPQSGSSQQQRRDYVGSLHRPESALSLRKDTSSLSSSRSSSIPVSSTTTSSASSSPLAVKGGAIATATPGPSTGGGHRLNNSPLPKPKRELYASRARQLDSLTRAQQNGYNYAGQSTQSPPPPLLMYKSSASSTMTTIAAAAGGSSSSSSSSGGSKKDLSSSFSQGQTRKAAPVAVRRVSSASVAAGRGLDAAGAVAGNGLQSTAGRSSSSAAAEQATGASNNSEMPDNGKPQRQTVPVPVPVPRRSRNLIREYLARTASAPPPIFKPSFQALSPPPPALQLAYTHPALLLLTDDAEDDVQKEPRDNSGEERNRDLAVAYVLDNSIELLDGSGSIRGARVQQQPPASFRLKRAAFSSIDLQQQPEAQSAVAAEQPREPGTRLRGKVTAANLIKTWEQLSAANAPLQSQSPRQQLTTGIRGLQSENFYDSIDDGEEEDDFEGAEVMDEDDQFVSELAQIPSMCDGDEDEHQDLRNGTTAARSGADAGGGGFCGKGGEAMAQFESLDKRKTCWSMDSV